MSLDRRQFLATASAALAAGALKKAPGGFDPQDWGAVRDQFDLQPGLAHLSMFYLTSHPRPVRIAIEDYRQQLDRNPYQTVEQLMFDKPENHLPTKIAARLASYTGVDASEIALTQNTTTGLSTLYHGLPLAPTDEVLVTTHDHYVHHESVRLATERAGASWRKITLYDSTDSMSAEAIAERVRKEIRPSTRVFGTTWVLSSDGVRMPLKAIADALATVNAQRPPEQRVLFFVDGVHGIGIEDPHLAALGCDGFAAGTHKWLFGPRGTGFIWARKEVWARMRPLIPTMTGLDLFADWRDGTPRGTPRAAWFSPGGFQAFEHLWAVPAALDFHQAIGPARITERVHALNLQLNQQLRALPNVTVRTPLDEAFHAGIVAFDVKGVDAGKAVAKLIEGGVLASTSPYRDVCVRLSCGIMNTTHEIEKAVAAVRGLA